MPYATRVNEERKTSKEDLLSITNEEKPKIVLNEMKLIELMPVIINNPEVTIVTLVGNEKFEKYFEFKILRYKEKKDIIVFYKGSQSDLLRYPKTKHFPIKEHDVAGKIIRFLEEKIQETNDYKETCDKCGQTI